MFRCIQVGSIKTIIDSALFLVIVNAAQFALSVLKVRLEMFLFWAKLILGFNIKANNTQSISRRRNGIRARLL